MKITKKTVRKTPVYDITVKDNHNFYANDILVHNCSEIALSSNKDESFVCVLSSMNALHYDEWKNTDAVQTMIIFLDTVVSEFLTRIEAMTPKTRFFMDRVYKFAKSQRALGLGVLGWHSYLMSKTVPFESRDAAKLNYDLFNHINREADKASKWMAENWGEPELMKGYGRRNSTYTAVAPTKSSSFILGQVSMSIEPEFSNYYIKDLAKAKATYKNPYLEKVLEKYGKNDFDTWDSIKKNDGSVQHLEFLSQLERDTFKALYEINPQAIVDQAAARQDFICQSQSLNLYVDPSLSPKEINQLYLKAWKLGIKTLYYQYSINKSQALARQKAMGDGCVACEA